MSGIFALRVQGLGFRFRIQGFPLPAFFILFCPSMPWLVNHDFALIPKQLLVSLVTALRYEGEEVNMESASDEAKILHEKISDKAYSDEELIRILSIRSKTQLIATFNQYRDKFGNAINKVGFKTPLKKLIVKFA